MSKLYSIIISTKNNEKTIKSVLMLALILVDIYKIEIIIVDGSSTDRTPKIIKDFVEKHKHRYSNIITLQDPGYSLSLSRNLGYKNSNGDVIIFLDGDTPLTSTFRYYLDKELDKADLISPLFECVRIDRATDVFNLFMKTVSFTQNNVVTGNNLSIKDPSILPPARVFKRQVLDKMKGYPVSSRFFGEDRIATALAVKMGFWYRFSPYLKLLKIDEPGFSAYWRKHYRYGLGISRDTTYVGKRLLRGYVVARRLNHLNVIIPLFSIIYAARSFEIERNLRKSIDVALMKYLIDLSILIGDLKGLISFNK
jgi:glycosyltransferase involved in cell wall biosynthesis